MKGKILSEDLVDRTKENPRWKEPCGYCKGKGWIEKGISNDLVPAVLISCFLFGLLCFFLGTLISRAGS